MNEFKTLNLERKIELYKCGFCGKAVSKPVSIHDDDEIYCKECAEEAMDRGDAILDSLAHGD